MKCPPPPIAETLQYPRSTAAPTLQETAGEPMVEEEDLPAVEDSEVFERNVAPRIE